MRIGRKSFLALFPERRLFFVVVCLSGILGFYLLSILPHQQAADRLEEQIVDLNRRLDEQRLLAPIYKRFTEMVGETRPALLGELPFPSPEQLTSEQLAGLEALLHQLAAQCQLDIRDIGADLNSMINETSALKLSLEIQGAFGHLRDFMLKLAELPFLEHIGRIEVRRAEGVRGLQMELDLWVARQ